MNKYMKKIDQSKFKAIKILLNGGATSREASEYMNVSTATISSIRNAGTYEEYKNTVAAKSMAKRKAEQQKPQETKPQTPAPVVKEVPAPVVKEVHQTVTIQATHYMMQELQKANKLLEQISAKLAYIVEDLYGTGKKVNE